MRVLIFIVRCLGISAILLYCAAAFAQDGDNQDITVNFPDEMTVSGTVSIDPGTFDPVDPELNDVTQFTNPVTSDGTSSQTIRDASNSPVTSKTYIDTFTTTINFSNNAWDSLNYSNQPFNYSINIDLPIIKYQTLFNDLQFVFFGSSTSNDLFKPFDQLKNGRFIQINNNLFFTVTDFTNTLNWEFKCYTPYAFSTRNPIFNSGGASNLAVIIQTAVSTLAWVGVGFSIIRTVRNG